MNIKDLIEQAKSVSGLQLGQMAEELHINQARISEWKKGKYLPGPSQIIYLADRAKLPAIEVLAELETETCPELADFWKKAVRELRQNQG